MTGRCACGGRKEDEYKKSGFGNWFQHPGDERREGGGGVYTSTDEKRCGARGVSCTRGSSKYLSSLVLQTRKNESTEFNHLLPPITDATNREFN